MRATPRASTPISPPTGRSCRRAARSRSPCGRCRPTCDSAANLAAKIALARQRGVDWVDFYHYGFIRLPVLDRVREAWRA